MWTEIEPSLGVGLSVVKGGVAVRVWCVVELDLIVMQMENECAPFLLGNCLLQRAAEAGNEAAALFLATSGAHVNHRNKWVSVAGQQGSGFNLWKK